MEAKHTRNAILTVARCQQQQRQYPNLEWAYGEEAYDSDEEDDLDDDDFADEMSTEWNLGSLS